MAENIVEENKAASENLQENINGTASVINQPSEKENQSQSFTQEQLNDIVRTRLKKAESSFYKNYGVESKEDLDKIVESSKELDGLRKELDGFKDENLKLKQELYFAKNNIKAERQDDVLTYLKGKGLDFTNENLTEALKSHPEWISDESNKTTISVLGGDHTPKEKSSDERSEAAKLFGFKKFVK